MEKVAFVLDTGSYFQTKTLKNIFVLPISIIITSKEGVIKDYDDSINISRKELEVFLDGDEQVSTAQPNIYKVQEKLEEIFKSFEKIIFIPLSKHLSGFYNTLKNLKQTKFNDNLILLDSESVGIDGEWIVDELSQLIQENKIELTQEAIDKYIDDRKKNICGSVIVASINQLIKGGRLRGLKATIAKTFKMKLTIKYQGDLQFHSKDLNLEAAISKAIKLIDSQNHFLTKGIKNISIMNDLKNKAYGEELVQKILKLLKIEKYTPSLLPGCIISHVGTDTFSILIESN